MQNKVNDIVSIYQGAVKVEDTNKLKYMIYSAHDDQIDSNMVWLTQSKASFDDIPYASQFIYELKYSESCFPTAERIQDCFGVSIAFNGTPLKLNTCNGDGFSENGTGCTWIEFWEYMNSIFYPSLNSEDLDTACYQPYNP